MEKGYVMCPRENCQGDARYAAPGRGHMTGCNYLQGADIPEFSGPKDLMTADERDIVGELGAIHVRICSIMGDEVSNDRFEVMLHIHALQNMMMSTAARRAYPDHFRMLGMKP